jgi:hypothetical protein
MKQTSIGLVFDDKQLLRMSNDKAAPRNRLLSVASRSVLQDEAEVHGYGCRTAANRNIGLADRGNLTEETRNHYLGFYHAHVEDVESCSDEIYETFVIEHEEQGEPAHCNLTLCERPSADDLPDKALSRTQIIIKLWRIMFGPARHVCDADAAIKDRLGAIILTEKARMRPSEATAE